MFNSYTDPEYWFYFGTAIFKNREDELSRKLIKDYDWQGAIAKADGIVLMYTID